VQVTDIIPRVLSTARNVRLYPLHSQTITASIEQLAEVLQGFLGRQPSLTLARASGSLLVNGRRVDTSDLGEISTGFIDFLKALGLNSLTFLRDVSAKEVSVFVSALRQTPASGYGIDFWKEFAKGNGLSHILFDEIVYDVKVAQTLREAEMSQPAEESEEAALEAGAKERLLTEDAAEDLSDQELVEEFSKEPFDAFLEAMPNRATDLLQQGNGKRVRQMLQWLFREFSSRDIGLREKIVNVSRVTLDTVPLGFKQGLTKLLADPLFVVFTNETDPKLVGVVAGLLHRMAGNLIQFSDYLLATRIFSQLHDRYKQLEETKDLRAQKLARILDRKLELKTQKLLMDDLHSGVPARQEHAAQVLGSLGPASMSMLVDIIKQEDDIRVGQLAAGLLAEQGPKAAKALKSELVLGMTGLERARILDVVDTVTRTLNTELAYSLGDRDPDVREAAFRLAERLNDKQVVTLLVDCAKGIETALATSAIRCLGKLKPSGITEFLVSLLTSSKDKARVIACCQALGQVGDPESVDPLVGILVAKGFLFIGNKWDAEIRAAAAFALRQISDPRAAQVLVTLANDRDPRIRQIAKAYG
ncbi:MAG: HEAT repeat domain-containing protein, partial [Nitrospiraceae bacterium]